MAALRTIVIFASSLLLMSMKPILQHRAQGAGAEPADPRWFLLLSETFKLIICLAILGWRSIFIGPEAAQLWQGLRHFAGFAKPACIYLMMNLIVVCATRILTPAAFQLLANMKIMCTAVAGRVVLSRTLEPKQWLAMVLLTFSTALGQLSTREGGDVDIGQTSLAGFLVMLFCSFLSAIGGVTTEKVLKADESKTLTIFATNVHMAGNTLVLNLLVYAVTATLGVDKAFPAMPRLSGAMLWALTNEALNGILLSSIMRFADSNVKNYAFSLSVFTTTAISTLMFGYQPRSGFYVAAALVVASMALYSRAAVKSKTG